MNFKELAISFDAQARPLEAAWAYEIAINALNAELELFLNLAVLYFECIDVGYAAHHHLPRVSTLLPGNPYAGGFACCGSLPSLFGPSLQKPS